MSSGRAGLDKAGSRPGQTDRGVRSARPGDLLIVLLIAVLPLNKVYWDLGVRIRPWYVVAPLALLVAGRRVLLTYSIPRPVRVTALGMWLIVVSGVASGLWAIDRSAWINNAGDMLLGVMVVLAVALAGIGPGRARRLVTWWVSVGVAMSLYGLAQYVATKVYGLDLDAYTVGRISVGLRRSGIDIYASYPRINSLIEDSSNYSVYLSTVWPLLLFRAMWGSAARSVSARYLIGLAIVSVNLVLTLSRSGLVGAFAGLLVAAVVVPAVAEADRRQRSGSRRTLGTVPARLGVVTAGLIAMIAVALRSALARLIDLRTQNSEGTQIHLATLLDSVRLTLSQPWGVGLGGFPRWYQIHRRPWEPAQTSTFNSFTDAATNAGALALVGYLLVLGSLARGLWARSLATADGRADAAGGLVAVASVSVAAFFYPVFATGYFVGFLGLLAAISSSPVEVSDA